MSDFTVTQPAVHTAPLGRPRAWDAVMNRSESRCECTGACGRPHTRTGSRCARQHDRGKVRLIVAPADLALPLTEAAHVPVTGLRAWCPDCHRLARRRRAQDAVQRAQHGNDPAPTLFDL
jgi:hypothetical protein